MLKIANIRSGHAEYLQQLREELRQNLENRSTMRYLDYMEGLIR